MIYFLLINHSLSARPGFCWFLAIVSTVCVCVRCSQKFHWVIFQIILQSCLRNGCGSVILHLFLKMTEKTHTRCQEKKARMTLLKGMFFTDGRFKAAVNVFPIFQLPDRYHWNWWLFSMTALGFVNSKKNLNSDTHTHIHTIKKKNTLNLKTFRKK